MPFYGNRRQKIFGPFQWQHRIWRINIGLRLGARWPEIWVSRILYRRSPWYKDLWYGLCDDVRRIWRLYWPWARIRALEATYVHNRKEIRRLYDKLDDVRLCLRHERQHWGVCGTCKYWLWSAWTEWGDCDLAQGRSSELTAELGLKTRCNKPDAFLSTHCTFGCRQFKGRE